MGRYINSHYAVRLGHINKEKWLHIKIKDPSNLYCFQHMYYVTNILSTDGELAVEAVRRSVESGIKFDLIFMDIQVSFTPIQDHCSSTQPLVVNEHFLIHHRCL